MAWLGEGAMAEYGTPVQANMLSNSRDFTSSTVELVEVMAALYSCAGSAAGIPSVQCFIFNADYDEKPIRSSAILKAKTANDLERLHQPHFGASFPAKLFRCKANTD